MSRTDFNDVLASSSDEDDEMTVASLKQKINSTLNSVNFFHKRLIDLKKDLSQLDQFKTALELRDEKEELLSFLGSPDISESLSDSIVNYLNELTIDEMEGLKTCGLFLDHINLKINSLLTDIRSYQEYKNQNIETLEEQRSRLKILKSEENKDERKSTIDSSSPTGILLKRQKEIIASAIKKSTESVMAGAGAGGKS